MRAVELGKRRQPRKSGLCATKIAILEADGPYQKECCDCQCKLLIRWTAVVDLCPGQNDNLPARSTSQGEMAAYPVEKVRLSRWLQVAVPTLQNRQAIFMSGSLTEGRRNPKMCFGSLGVGSVHSEDLALPAIRVAGRAFAILSASALSADRRTHPTNLR